MSQRRSLSWLQSRLFLQASPMSRLQAPRDSAANSNGQASDGTRAERPGAVFTLRFLPLAGRSRQRLGGWREPPQAGLLRALTLIVPSWNASSMSPPASAGPVTRGIPAFRAGGVTGPGNTSG